MSKLNIQQENFCLEFVKDLHGTNAAIRAGYSEKTAAVIACENLKKPNISARIRSIMQQRQKRMEITGDMVIQRLSNIAFGHIGKVCIITDEGLELRDQDEMTDEELSIISEIQISPVTEKGMGVVGYDKKVKMRDSIKALELLSKHLGLLDGTGASSKDQSALKRKLSGVFAALSKDK